MVSRRIRRTYEEAWDSAVALYRLLSQGADLMEAEGSPVELGADEIYLASDELTYSRYFGLDGSVTLTAEPARVFPFRSPWGMVADSVRRAADRRTFERMVDQMERENAPRWRDRQTVRTVLTDERLLCDANGEWLSFWYDAITGMVVAVREWAFEFDFEHASPLRLEGPMAPAFALAVAYFGHGEEILADPSFNLLADAAPMPAI